MKRKVIAGLFSCVLLVLIVSCENASTNPDLLTEETKASNPYDDIGRMHNEGLSYVLNYISVGLPKKHTHAKADGTDQIAGLYDSMFDGIRRFTETRNMQCPELFKNNRFMHKINDQSKNSSYNGKMFKAVVHTYDCSNEESEYLSQLETDIMNTPSRRDLKRLIKERDKEIVRIFEKHKAKHILSGTSIMVHSTKYWEENIDAWIAAVTEYVNSNSTGSSASDNKNLLKLSATSEWDWLKKIAVADVAGGVGGGLVGAATGAVATLGAGTVPGWVAGAVVGSLGASSIECVTQILNSI